jgi:2-amino-4-hydroxy-6-hydroxymethyldihydropteridine diphosphokinase
MASNFVEPVYLALGTNLGDRAGNLRRALESLPPHVTVLEGSPVYETPPWGVSDQPAFLNMVVRCRTSLLPLTLLHRLKRLEKRLGRQPSMRYGPRLIDLDILFYADLVLETPHLSIPHASLHERAFVLVPLCDLAPDFVHPRLGWTVRQMLAGVDTQGVVRYEPGA